MNALLLLGMLVGSPEPVPVDWFFRSQDIATHAISRFEVQTNFGGFQSVAMPIAGTRPDWSIFATPIEVETVYRVDIRACNATECGPAYVRAPLLQQPPIVVAGDKFGWDYLDANIATVNRFEVLYDSGAWTPVGIPADQLIVAGGKTYRVPVPTTLSQGTHTFSVRACSVEVCGAALGPLGFAFAVVPPTPTNLRIFKGV
jgi:hypothetical protein